MVERNKALYTALHYIRIYCTNIPIFISHRESFYESEYLWEEFPPELSLRQDAMREWPFATSILSPCRVFISFGRSCIVQLIPLTLNTANWCQPFQPERENCSSRASYRWITLETPFPVRRPFKLVSVQDTLSAIKIKCLYKVNRRKRKTLLIRSTENVNWMK